IGLLLSSQNSVPVTFLPEAIRGVEIGRRAAEREIDRNRADVTARRRSRIEIADHALIVGLQEILPAGWDRLAAKRILVHEQAERSGMDGGPVTVGVLEAGGDLIPVDGLIGFKCILRLGLHPEGDAEIA